MRSVLANTWMAGKSMVRKSRPTLRSHHSRPNHATTAVRDVPTAIESAIVTTNAATAIERIGVRVAPETIRLHVVSAHRLVDHIRRTVVPPGAAHVLLFIVAHLVRQGIRRAHAADDTAQAAAVRALQTESNIQFKNLNYHLLFFKSDSYL